MAKSLVGASAGGKVTLSGLDGDFILDEHAVSVMQGAKSIVNVTGKLSVLAFGGTGQSGGCFLVWNGSSYQKVASTNTNTRISATVAGTPMLVIGICSSADPSGDLKACGVTIPKSGSLVISNKVSGNSLSGSYWSVASVAVLGAK